MNKIILFLITVFTSLLMNAQDISGQWNGVLKSQSGELRLVINITKTQNGYVSTMDSPDQGVKGMPVKNTSFENLILKLDIAVGTSFYEGTLNANNSITGKLTQNGQSFELNFSKEIIKKAVVVRPQEPQKPFSYYTENVKFENKTAKITLAGTLSLPKKEGNFPAVILITGSGPQNRDEEMAGHKPFLVLSDYLTKRGFAVLRFDDRGFGESTGDFKNATTKDFANDVRAGVDFLKNRKEINKKKIGLIGHSEGGIIAPIVAADSKDIGFIILMAGTGIRGDKVLLTQQELISKHSGSPEEEIRRDQENFKQAYEYVVTSSENDTNLRNTVSAHFKAKSSNDEIANMRTSLILSPWMYEFLRLDPAPFLEKVKCPVLAINGSKDLQVPAEINLQKIQMLLDKGGNKKVSVKQLPNLNHLFQECKTGLPNEYAAIEQTLSPIALEEISNWLSMQTK